MQPKRPFSNTVCTSVGQLRYAVVVIMSVIIMLTRFIIELVQQILKHLKKQDLIDIAINGYTVKNDTRTSISCIYISLDSPFVQFTDDFSLEIHEFPLDGVLEPSSWEKGSSNRYLIEYYRTNNHVEEKEFENLDELELHMAEIQMIHDQIFLQPIFEEQNMIIGYVETNSLRTNDMPQIREPLSSISSDIHNDESPIFSANSGLSYYSDGEMPETPDPRDVQPPIIVPVRMGNDDFRVQLVAGHRHDDTFSDDSDDESSDDDIMDY